MSGLHTSPVPLMGLLWVSRGSLGCLSQVTHVSLVGELLATHVSLADLSLMSLTDEDLEAAELALILAFTQGTIQALVHQFWLSTHKLELLWVRFDCCDLELTSLNDRCSTRCVVLKVVIKL
jgi:hypothetical protein